jgi:tetratricopeptide (TPR) repeat protein
MRNAGGVVAAAVFLATLAPWSRGGSKADENPAKIAHDYLDRGDFAKAIEHFEAALAKKSEQKGLRVLCAFAYLKQNQLDKAEQLLKKEMEFAPDSQDARALLGLVYFRQGRGAEAEAACREFVAASTKKGRPAGHRPLVSGWGESRKNLSREESNTGLPFFILGLLYEAQGRFDEAIEDLGAAREAGYDELACHLHVLSAELGRHGWERVLELAPQLSKRGGGVSAEARTFQAIALDAKGLDQEALDCLQQSASLKPLEPWALKNLAIYHLNRNEFEEALPFVRKALRFAPLDFQGRFLLEQAQSRRHIVDREHRLPFTTEFMGTIVPEYRHTFARDEKIIAREVHEYALGLIRAGLLPEAAEVLRRFLELDDFSASLNYNLAQLYNAANMWAEALRYGLRAIDLRNNFRDAHDLVANVLFKMEDFEDSILFYRLAVIFAPGDALGYYNLGCAYRAMKEDAEAEKQWLSAVKHDKPGPPPAGLDTGTDKRPDDLHVDLQVRAEPVSFDAYISLASLYLDEKRPEAALDAFTKASEIMPLRQEPHLEMGKIYLTLNNAAKARDCFEKYISLGGDESKVKELLNKSTPN